MMDERPGAGVAPALEQAKIDPLLPAEMAHKAEVIGAAKARLDVRSLFMLAVLAGAFIALGAMFATTVATGSAELPFGVGRLLAGFVFSTGLILVVIGGAELFTGNNLMVMAWASRHLTMSELSRAWVLVYLGNLVGSLGTVALVFLGGQYLLGGGAVGATALAIAAAKAELPFVSALFLAILANVLVCLAVWLTYGARTVTGKILAIVPPITAFVAAGFEHSIANMYFLPMGLAIKAFAPAEFWTAIGTSAASFQSLTVAATVANLVPVTIGNVIGGGVLVGAVYWFVYLHRRQGP